MVRLSVVVAVALLAAGVAVGVTFNEGAAQDVAKARSEAMKKMGGALGKIAKVAKGEAEYSPALVEDAKVIKATSEVLLTVFPEGSIGGRSKPEIWTDWNGFMRNAEALKAAAPALVAAVESGDRGKIGAALGTVGKTCGGCHDNFRKPKE